MVCLLIVLPGAESDGSAFGTDTRIFRLTANLYFFIFQQIMGRPVDMIGTAIFLASKASAFVSGQIIRVDGGASAGNHWPIANDFLVSES